MTEDKEILPFYLELKEKREIKNLDINKISEETKINIKHLRAIESGDFNNIPTTYLRLFIKTYAQYLKLDYRQILNNYELESNKKNKSIFKKPQLINIHTNRLYWHAGAGIDNNKTFDRLNQEIQNIGKKAISIDNQIREKVKKLWYMI
jgi:transcriptional regulator with XRE-family HTH domain